MIISISNHKGGVGKTTTVVNLGAGLARAKKKVLLVDLDPQANLSQSLRVSELGKTIYGALRGKYPIEPITIAPRLDVVPSTLDLSGAEIELSNEAGREYILQETLEPVVGNYDYILIDCPPSLGLLTINAFTASQKVVIPLQAHYLALQGVAKLVEVIEKIQKRLNKELELGGVLVTQYDGRKVLHKETLKALEGHFQKLVFKTKIRENVALAEAPATGEDIFTYQAKSNGAEDYKKLSKEVLKRF